jgi:hypothetical protein
MKNPATTLFLTRLFILACLFLSFPAAAEEEDEDEKYSSGSRVVTPVEDCLDQLSPEDAADIRATSITPYEDCNRRLQRQRLEKKSASEKKKAAEEEAETPSNFMRVTEEEEDEAEEKPAPGKKHR